MKKNELIEMLNKIPDNLNIELLVIDKGVVHFANVDNVVEYGRDPTMKTIRITGQKLK